MENPLFKVIFSLDLSDLSDALNYDLVCNSGLRGNLEYDKTVFLNKVACALDYNYWHIGVSLSRTLFIITIYCYVICACLSFLGMGV